MPPLRIAQQKTGGRCAGLNAKRQTANAKRQIRALLPHRRISSGTTSWQSPGTAIFRNPFPSPSSYGHAGRSVAELELEVGELLRKAERADTTPRDDGLDLPAEIERRQKRLEALRKARAVIEERARERAAKERPEYERKACDPESASPETLHPRAFTGHVSPR